MHQDRSEQADPESVFVFHNQIIIMIINKRVLQVAYQMPGFINSTGFPAIDKNIESLAVFITGSSLSSKW